MVVAWVMLPIGHTLRAKEGDFISFAMNIGRLEVSRNLGHQPRTGFPLCRYVEIQNLGQVDEEDPQPAIEPSSPQPWFFSTF